MKNTLRNLTRRVLGIAVVLSILTISFNSHAYESELSDSERRELFNLILEFYDELGTQIPSANRMHDFLLTAPDDVIDSMIDGIDDPHAYMRSLRDFLVRQQASYPSNREQESLTATSRVGGLPFTQVAGFPPDYPVLVGIYLTQIQRLISVGLQPSGKTAAELSVLRCDGAEYSNKLEAILIASGVASAANAVCAGLDGVPFADNIACVAAATADGVLDGLERELGFCDFHDGYINAAEIEAAYENSKLILGQVNKIGSNIDVIESTIFSSRDTIVNSVNGNVNNQFTSLNSSLNSSFNTVNGSLVALSTTVNSFFSTLNTYLIAQFAGLNSKADSIQSAIAAVSGQADGLGEQSAAIQSSLDELDAKTDVLDGKVDVLDDKVDTLDNKANILDDKISRCEVEIAMDSQSLRTAQGNFRFFLLVTLYGSRVEVDDSTFWINGIAASGPIVDDLMTGVQRVELDKQLIPAGESVPLIVDVNVSDGDCSGISMIQRGNP